MSRETERQLKEAARIYKPSILASTRTLAEQSGIALEPGSEEKPEWIVEVTTPEKVLYVRYSNTTQNLSVKDRRPTEAQKWGLLRVRNVVTYTETSNTGNYERRRRDAVYNPQKAIDQVEEVSTLLQNLAQNPDLQREIRRIPLNPNRHRKRN